MSQGTNNQFQQILTAAKERKGDMAIDTMIVSSHLAQMRMFMLRRGIEFYAEQDSFGKRKEFLARVFESNMLDMKLDSIVDYFLCDGQGLFYFRPTGDDYQLLFFPKDSYRAYRAQDGTLESVVITYSFQVREPNGMDQYPSQTGRGGKLKYIRLKVYKDRIEQTISNEKLEFENEMGTMTMNAPGDTEVLANSLGFIPAVEVFNHMDCTGSGSGNGEFDWMANQILFHDELVRNVRKNIKFFGNPTLISSRPKHDITESGDEQAFRPTISSQAGFYAQNRPSTRVSEPFGGVSPLDGQIKVPRVIANLEPTDRINYITPDAVSGDQNLYVKQYRQEIRLALGGVDDLDFGTASSAYEIKSLYGRVAATAEKKTRGLFDYGLCRLFQMMISVEEEMFRRSFAAALGLEDPEPPLPEDFEEVDEFVKEQEKYGRAKAKYEKTINEELNARLETGDIPPGVTGLIPDGNTKVSWRWTGNVFEDSTDDILNNSIVVRNMQELGVDSIEALKFLFPGKTDEERAAMLTGYPFRMVRETQQSFSTFVGLLGQLYQLPHPQTPDLPLASDPNLDITGFLYRSLEFLRKELSYSGQYKPSSDASGPDRLSDADRLRAERGTEPRDEPRFNLAGLNGPGGTPAGGGAAPGLPTAGGPAGFPTGPLSGAGQSVAGSIPGALRQFEYKQPLPGPGITLGVNGQPGDTNAPGSYTGQLPFTADFGAADLRSPSFNPAAGLPGDASAGGKRGRAKRKR